MPLPNLIKWTTGWGDFTNFGNFTSLDLILCEWELHDLQVLILRCSLMMRMTLNIRTRSRATVNLSLIPILDKCMRALDRYILLIPFHH